MKMDSQINSGSTSPSLEEMVHNGLYNLKQAMTNSLRRKISHKDKKTNFRVAVIGAKSVGKSAITVRIKTGRFIYDYAPNLETKCNFSMPVDEELVNVEILDTAALQTAENTKIEQKIRWADAFILVYSITDEESLAALVASKCLINLYAKNKKKGQNSGSHSDLLVALVGNKSDLTHERVISEKQGRKFAEVNECSHFFEMSTRESYHSVKAVFSNLYRAYRARSPRLTKSHQKSVKLSKEITESTEDELMSAVKMRGRSRTTLETAANPEGHSSKSSPVTFRKITEECSAYSSSPDEDRQFVGEQILYTEQELSNLCKPSRRVTVHSPTPATKTSRPQPIRRMESDNTIQSDGNNNQNFRIPKVTIQLPS